MINFFEIELDRIDAVKNPVYKNTTAKTGPILII